MYRPPPAPHRPFRPYPSHPHHLPPPPTAATPHARYICDICAVQGQHFKRDCPSWREWKRDKAAKDEYQNRRSSLVHGSGGAGGRGFPRGVPGCSQRSFDGGGGAGAAAVGPGPSHHRLSSNSSNAPNPNLLPSNPYTHPRRPSTSDAQAQAPPFPPLFAPADCWSPGGDELDYELEEARRSRERRKDEERQLRKERERERERERSRQDENEDDEQEESASKRRSLRKRREREEEERERERGRKRERRDSGLEEGTVSRRRDGGSRSRESSAAADRGRRPVLPENKIRARQGFPSERSPKKNRRPRSPRLPQDSHSSTTYGPPRPTSPPTRPLLSRIHRAEELIQVESQVQKNAEESSKNAGTYTGPSWNTGFSHYNEKIGLRQRMGSLDNKGGASFRIPGDDDRSIPFDVIGKVDPMINLTHQRQHDAAQNFSSWPVGAIEGVNIPYRPWNPQAPPQVFQPPFYSNGNVSPIKSWKNAPREPQEGGYEIEYPSGKSSFIPADSGSRPLPPLEHGRLLLRRDTYFPSYSDEEEGADDLEGRDREVPSRPSSDAGSSVSHRRRSSEEEEQSSKPDEPAGTEDWDTLSICQDDPVEYRSDEHQHEDGGRGRGGRDDSPSDRSMGSHSPSPRRDRDRSESPLGGRSPSNALGIDLRPGHSDSALPPLGRVQTPTQLVQPSSRLHDDLPPISPSTLATLLPESVPVRRLMLSIARPPRLSSSRALGAFASSDSIQTGTNTPVLSPRMPSCTSSDQGLKATLPDEEGRRRLLFVGRTGAGASFWEGGDFGPMERERESEEEVGSEREDGGAVEEVKGREKKLVSGVGATSSSATVVPRPSTSNHRSPLPTHPYRHSPDPRGSFNFNQGSRGGGGRGGSTSTRWPARSSSGPLPPQAHSWMNRTQTQTPTNSSTSLPHQPPPPSTSTNEGRAGLPPSSDLDSSSQPNATAGYNKSPEELRARVVLSLKRQKKESPTKPKPSIIIHSTSTSIVPPNSFLGLYNDAATSPPAPTPTAESAPTTATASTSSTVPTLPSNVYLEILKHLGNQQHHQPSDSSVKEWNDAVEGSKKVGVETAPSEPENSVVSQESEEAEVEEGEIDEMGVEVGVGMEGVEELGERGGEGMAGEEAKEEPLDRAKFKASFRTIASSEPAAAMEGEGEGEVKEEEEGVGMEEVEG